MCFPGNSLREDARPIADVVGVRLALMPPSVNDRDDVAPTQNDALVQLTVGPGPATVVVTGANRIPIVPDGLGL